MNTKQLLLLIIGITSTGFVRSSQLTETLFAHENFLNIEFSNTTTSVSVQSNYSSTSDENVPSALSQVVSATGSAVSTVGSASVSALEFGFKNYPIETATLVGSATLAGIGYASFKVHDWWSKRQSRLQIEHMERNKEEVKKVVEEINTIYANITQQFENHTITFEERKNLLEKTKKTLTRICKKAKHALNDMENTYKKMADEAFNYKNEITEINTKLKEAIIKFSTLNKYITDVNNTYSNNVENLNNINNSLSNLQKSTNAQNDSLERIHSTIDDIITFLSEQDNNNPLTEKV